MAAKDINAIDMKTVLKTNRFQWLKNKKVIVGLVLVGFMFLLGLLGPLFVPDPNMMNPANRLAPPILFGGSIEHILGTDQLGRDLLSRLVYGMRTSILISVAAAFLSFMLGTLVGMISGYFGKMVDTVLMRLTDIQLAFPFIILAVAVLSVVRPTVLIITVVLTFVNWPIYARVVRSVMLSEKENDYVNAAKIIGASGSRVIRKYIGPIIIPGIITVAALDVATLIVYEAVLGFLGLGIQPPDPSWGNIMADGRQYIENAWWIITLPGIFIFITVLGINLIGDNAAKKSN